MAEIHWPGGLASGLAAQWVFLVQLYLKALRPVLASCWRLLAGWLMGCLLAGGWLAPGALVELVRIHIVIPGLTILVARAIY